MDRPTLELPQKVAVSRPVFDRRGVFFFVFGLAAVAMIIWVQLRGRPAASVVAGARPGVEAETVALRLEDKNLAGAAAEAWREYLATADVPSEKAAQVQVRIARLCEKAGRYEEAIAAIYRAEALAGDGREKLGADLPMLLRECFQQLGRYGELSREVEERTSMAAKPGDMSGRQIVAEIGDDKITLADFERLVHDEIEAMIETTPGGPDQRETVRKQLHEQMSRPESRANMLKQLVVRRVLASEARQRKLDQDAAFRKRLLNDADGLLAAQLTSAVASERATVTPQDVERYFAANDGKYRTPARGRLGRIACKSKEDAAKVVELVAGGADFSTLAKDRGGLTEGVIAEDGAELPEVGGDASLRRRLWALDAGEVTKDPIESGDAWHVYKMMDKKTPVTPKLEQVRERVEADCAAARRSEVLQEFVNELMERHRVRIHERAIPTTQAGTSS